MNILNNEHGEQLIFISEAIETKFILFYFYVNFHEDIGSTNESHVLSTK